MWLTISTERFQLEGFHRKILVFSFSIRLLEMVAYVRWSHVKVRLWLLQSLSSTVTFLSDARQPEVSFFSLLICLDATKFVWLSVFTLTETICPKVCSKSQLKCAKISLRIDVRCSKRSLLNYLLFKTSLEYKKAVTAYPTCQCFTWFCATIQPVNTLLHARHLWDTAFSQVFRWSLTLTIDGNFSIQPWEK